MEYIIGYIGKNYGIYLKKLWDIPGKNYRIDSSNTMRYIEQKLWEILWYILGKHYEIYCVKTMWYIGKKQ